MAANVSVPLAEIVSRSVRVNIAVFFVAIISHQVVEGVVSVNEISGRLSPNQLSHNLDGV